MSHRELLEKASWTNSHSFLDILTSRKWQHTRPTGSRSTLCAAMNYRIMSWQEIRVRIREAVRQCCPYPDWFEYVLVGFVIGSWKMEEVVEGLLGVLGHPKSVSGPSRMKSTAPRVLVVVLNRRPCPKPPDVVCSSVFLP